MKKIENEKYIVLNISEKVGELNRLLIEVNWEDVNFDCQSFQNGITPENEQLHPQQKALIDAIIDNIPEWKKLLSRKQHYIHDYCLDIHTLSVIKKLREFKSFENLDNYEKLVLLYSALLHDIEKYENDVDPEHPVRGAKTSSSILFRLGFSEDFISNVYLLINYHQVLGLMAARKISFSDEELVGIFRNSSLLDLQTMLSIADIKSVKKNESFFNEDLNKKLEEITNSVKELFEIFNPPYKVV